MREFNLIDEPWIMVRCRNGKVKPVSLREALLSAHTFISLAGETKAQDFAVFRLMLALLYTVFSRYDIDGQENDTDDADLALDRWKEIWDNGKLPAAPIERYLTEWHERFWLFDDEFPFYQTHAVKDKGECATAKMIGTLFESNNKSRLFSDRNQEGRMLSYAEAARWLIHLSQFDDIAAKQPTPKKTWCGRLSMIALTGDNLFRTLMLNYRADYDIRREKSEVPTWETDRRQIVFNRQIAVPDNQAALLTIQSRNLLLCEENGAVSAYKLAGGDWFEEEAVFDEQMTLWNGYQDKKASHPEFKPKRYDTSKLIWQEFSGISALAVTQKDAGHFVRPAGVIEWLHELLKYRFLSEDYNVKICTAAVIYDYKQATSLPVLDAVSDTLTFHAKLLEDVGADWRRTIIEEIGKCEKAAVYVYLLYRNLQQASGRRDKDAKESKSGEQDAKQEYYARIDRHFRLWLAELDPDADREDYAQKLEYILRRTAISYGRELAGQIGAQAIFGKYIEKEINGKKQKELVSAAGYLEEFIRKTLKLFCSEPKDYQQEVKRIEQA